MIITFKGKLDEAPWNIVSNVTDAVSKAYYGGNVYAAQTWAKGKRVRFTLETRNSRAHGSRTSWSGRHMKKASWEAHRDVMRAILTLHQDAVLRTAMATYRGLDGFEAEYAATATKNIGSQMQPCTMRECTV